MSTIIAITSNHYVFIEILSYYLENVVRDGTTVPQAILFEAVEAVLINVETLDQIEQCDDSTCKHNQEQVLASFSAVAVIFLLPSANNDD